MLLLNWAILLLEKLLLVFEGEVQWHLTRHSVAVFHTLEAFGCDSIEPELFIFNKRGWRKKTGRDREEEEEEKGRMRRKGREKSFSSALSPFALMSPI